MSRVDVRSLKWVFNTSAILSLLYIPLKLHYIFTKTATWGDAAYELGDVFLAGCVGVHLAALAYRKALVRDRAAMAIAQERQATWAIQMEKLDQFAHELDNERTPRERTDEQ